MKHLLMILGTCLMMTATAIGQGQIVVANSAAVNGVRANVTDGIGTPLTGATFWAQVYAGPSADSLTAQGTAVNFRTGANAGLISAQTLSVNSVAPGGNVFVQLRAWEGPAGSTYESSVGVRGSGFSNIVGPFVTGGAGIPPSTPPNITGLQSFGFCSLCPEPSTYAMGLIGAGALLLRRIRCRQKS